MRCPRLSKANERELPVSAACGLVTCGLMQSSGSPDHTISYEGYGLANQPLPYRFVYKTLTLRSRCLPLGYEAVRRIASRSRFSHSSCHLSAEWELSARGATAARFNRAVCERLKPGGSYIIVDHVDFLRSLTPSGPRTLKDFARLVRVRGAASAKRSHMNADLCASPKACSMKVRNRQAGSGWRCRHRNPSLSRGPDCEWLKRSRTSVLRCARACCNYPRQRSKLQPCSDPLRPRAAALPAQSVTACRPLRAQGRNADDRLVR